LNGIGNTAHVCRVTEQNLTESDGHQGGRRETQLAIPTVVKQNPQ
jgi:hypothetical protein